MKSRLNITIDETLIDQAKNYAEANHISLSRLIEESLRKIVGKPKPRTQSVFDVLKKMPKPRIDTEHYSTEHYLEENKEKYGI